MPRDRSPSVLQLPFWPGLVVKANAPARSSRRSTATSAATSVAASATASPGPSPASHPSRGRRHVREALETPEERAVRERLQGCMSARVALKNNKGRGSFTVHFGSYDQLDEIMRRIDA